MIVVLCALVGWLAAATIWNVARNQATRRPLFGGAASDTTADGMPPVAWLPLFGLLQARTDPANGLPQSRWRPIFELATAAYFAVAAAQLGTSVELAAVLIFSLPLLVIGLVDYWTRLIHSVVVLAGIGVGLLFALRDGPRGLAESALAMVLAALAFGLFYVLAIVVYKNPKASPFGLGDVYLAAMIGAMVGLDDVVRALFLGMLISGVILGSLLMVKVLDRKQTVAYGPYLCLGALLTLVLS